MWGFALIGVGSAKVRGAGRSRLAVIFEDGVVSGAIGGATVAAFFLLVDALSGRPLYTPTLLGSMLLLGASPAEVSQPVASIVVRYTLVHLILFSGAGLAAAYAVSELERRPHLGLLLLLLFGCFEAGLLALALAFAPGLVAAVGGGLIAAANLLSAGAMAAYLLGRHPSAIAGLGAGQDR